MIEILAFVAAAVMIVHITFLLTRRFFKKNCYNYLIYLSGGRYAGDYQGASHGLIEPNGNDDTDTFVKRREPVTSSFSTVYIRLYQVDTRRCYEAYLENELQIGRSGGNGEIAELILDDPMVSKKHCMIYRRGDQILIQDLGSTNHTYVNGCRIQGAMPLSHGDHLILGRSQYQFQCYCQR